MFQSVATGAKQNTLFQLLQHGNATLRGHIQTNFLQSWIEMVKIESDGIAAPTAPLALSTFGFHHR